MMNTNFLSISEAAQELGLTRRDVNQLVADGRLTGYQFGRHLQIKADDLAAFIHTSKMQANFAQKQALSAH